MRPGQYRNDSNFGFITGDLVLVIASLAIDILWFANKQMITYQTISSEEKNVPQQDDKENIMLPLHF